MGKINELGNKYGTMIVVREVPKEERPSTKRVYWELQCELCGEKRIADGGSLRQFGIRCNCQKCKDLTGQTFERLTVVRMATKEERGDYKAGMCWCQCSCGNPELVLVRSNSLKTGHVKSCGCLHKETAKAVFFKDLIGQRFNKLTVKRQATVEEKKQNNKNDTSAWWWCDCDCGMKNVLVRGTSLRRGETKSCGCLSSNGEELIRQILRDNDIQFEKEYSFNDLLGDYYPLRFDFAIFNNNKLVGLIECDGEFHRTDKFGQLERQQRYDQLKDDYCHSHSIPLLRIEYHSAADIKEDTILDFIKDVK